MSLGTQEQIEWAEKRYAEHRIACLRDNFLPDHKKTYIADCIRNYDALKDIENYRWTKDNIADNVTERRYPQYESPRQTNI